MLTREDLGPDYGVSQEGYERDGERSFTVVYVRDPETLDLETLRTAPAAISLTAIRTDSSEAAGLAREALAKVMAPTGAVEPVPIEPIGDAAAAYRWRQSQGDLAYSAWIVFFRRENLVLVVVTFGLGEGNSLEAAVELARASDARVLEVLSGERPAAAGLARSPDRGTRPGSEEWATVAGVSGAAWLHVVTDGGLTATVQQIGIRSPVPGQPLAGLADQQLQARLVGQRVRLLPGEPDRIDAGVLRRHVFLEGHPAPLAADLLGAGWAW